MIGIVTVDVQREIISCLPEVVEDSEHGTVATALRDLLSHNTQLTVPILDALANLNLTPELLTEVSWCLYLKGGPYFLKARIGPF